MHKCDVIWEMVAYWTEPTLFSTNNIAFADVADLSDGDYFYVHCSSCRGRMGWGWGWALVHYIGVNPPVAFVADRSKFLLFPWYMFVACICESSVFLTFYIYVISMSWSCAVRVAVCCVCCVSCMYSFLSLTLQLFPMMILVNKVWRNNYCFQWNNRINKWKCFVQLVADVLWVKSRL